MCWESFSVSNAFVHYMIQGITVESSKVVENIKKHSYPCQEDCGKYTIQSPDGYKFHILNKQTTGGNYICILNQLSTLYKLFSC